MLKDIALGKNMFGVTLFEPKNEFEEKPKPGTIGCVAEICESQEMDDGRSNILTAGIIRYHLIDYVDVEKPYLVGDIEFFEDNEEDENALKKLSDDVFNLFRRAAKAAHKLSRQQGEFPEVQQAPAEQLSFLISAAFNLDSKSKHEMLKMRKTSERLDRLKRMLSKTVSQVEENAEIDKISRKNGHAKKKINLDL